MTLSVTSPATATSLSSFTPGSGPAAGAWNYEAAFCRNLGLVDEAEQQKLRGCRVAIAGLGGVGGGHLVTLARLGIGKFSIADPDTFELANFNRQHGAAVSTLGRPKADVMATAARDINPQLDLRVFKDPIDAGNVDSFLEGADLFVDGVDFFAIEARRRLFAAARQRGIWGVTAGPIGFSAAWLTFDPRGMTFDSYFDLRDGQDRAEQLVAFAVGLCPQATHLKYMDLGRVDPRTGAGPSAALAYQLASGIVAAEALRILLARPGARPAPAYHQFDAYRCKFRTGTLNVGNRSASQRLKRWWVKKIMEERIV